MTVVRESEEPTTDLIISALEDEISGSIHPVRWAAVLAIAFPLALSVIVWIAKFSGGDTQRPLRLLRDVLAAELITLMVLCAIGYLYEHRARERDAKLYHPPGQLVDVGGYRLHIYCEGSGGPTVVLEHGHQGSYLDWYLVQPLIAKFTRVCSYDRAGYGWSEPSPRERRSSEIANELHTLLRNAGEKPPYILVGHSFGALNVEMFAHQFPDETAAVVLVDGTVPAPEVFTVREKLWLRMMQWTMPFGLPRWRRWCGSSIEPIRGVSEAVYCRSHVYDTIYREWSKFPESSAEVRRINSFGTTPFIVIARDPAVGNNSAAEVTHQQKQRDLLKLSLTSSFVLATGSGHDIPLKRPDVIVDAVKDLIMLPARAGSRETP